MQRQNLFNEENPVLAEKKLMLAAWENNIEAVHSLLDADVDVNKKDRYGSTPLILATVGSNIHMVRYLVKAKADVNEQSQEGSSALMFAVGNKDIVNYLLSVKSSVNKQDRDGTTALMMAIWENNRDVVDSLMSARAKLEVINKRQKTAFDYALEKQNLDIIRLLVEAGARIRNSKKLFILLKEADQCDPTVLSMLSKLVEQQNEAKGTARLEETDYQELMRYQSLLSNETDKYRADKSLVESDKLPLVLNQIVLAYDSPLERGFFGVKATPKQIEESAKPWYRQVFKR